jgi:hypothetical protein
MTTGCKVVGEPSASVDADNAETAVAKVRVEADGILEPAAAANVGDTGRAVAMGVVEADGSSDIMASFPPEEVETAAPAMVVEKVGETVGETAATLDDKLGVTGRTAFPGGTISDNTGSGRVLPCMKVRTREGCEVRGVDWEGDGAIRCGESTRARSTNSFPLGVVGELLYGVRARVTPVDGAAVFP